MPDDITLNPMQGGETVAADHIDGKHYQRIKLIHGADGVNDGDVADANPLPVAAKLRDENGVAYGVRHADNKPRVSSTPYLFDIVEGNISGHTATTTLGYNADVDDVREDLWEIGGVYVFPTAGIQMKLASSSANDTALGTGARTIDIHYLDTNYAEQSETIILDGITPKNTVATNILRINDMHVMTVGSSGTAVGNLSLTNLAGTITYGYIGANGNASRQAIYTVPAGKTFYITGWNVGVGHQSGNRFAEFTLRVTTSHDTELTPRVFHFKHIINIQDGAIFIPFCLPVKCIAQSDVKISVISDSANANAICAGHFAGWLV